MGKLALGLAAAFLMLGCHNSTSIPIDQTKKANDLPVPHHHQVFNIQDWSGGRTFTHPTTKEVKSILYASCWPSALTDVLLYYKVVKDNPGDVATATKKAYDAFADFDDGAHTGMIPLYLAFDYPGLYARKFDVSSLKSWPSERKWQIVKGAIDHGWPVLVSVTWVKPRGKIFPHAFVIRGYQDSPVPTAIVNDPAGSYTMTGKWDSSVSGEKQVYKYDDFFDRYFIFVVPSKDKKALDDFLGQFRPAQ